MSNVRCAVMLCGGGLLACGELGGEYTPSLMTSGTPTATLSNVSPTPSHLTPTVPPVTETATAQPSMSSFGCEVVESEPYGGVCISEVLTDNEGSFPDEEGDFEDWIEVHNASDSPVSLLGLYLSDDNDELDKWALPDRILESDERLIIFASKKDSREGELHTNFRLDRDGEFLGLSDGQQFIREIDPIPPMPEDVSYEWGSGLGAIELFDGAHLALVIEASLAPEGWTQPDFQGDDGWISTTASLAKDSMVDGWKVTKIQSAISLIDILAAQEVLRSDVYQLSKFEDTLDFLDMSDGGGSGHFEDGSAFPGQGAGGGENDFLIQAQGTVYLPEPGSYTFGVHSDDGFSLEVGGEYLSTYVSTRGSEDTLGTFEASQAGFYDVNILYFERSGGAVLEVFAAAGDWSTFEEGPFELLGLGTLPVQSAPLNDTDNYLNSALSNWNTLVSQGENSIAMRIPFQVNDPSALDGLNLDLKYDDAFMAYLNGHLVAQSDGSGEQVKARDAAEAKHAESFDLSQALLHLRAGQNVFAIEVLDAEGNDEQLLLSPRLTATSNQDVGPWFFQKNPSPGAASVAYGYLGAMPEVDILPKGGILQEPTQVYLVSEGDSQIRYTLDGSVPTLQNGLIYEGPLMIEGTTILRAAAFRDGYESSEVSTQSYLYPDTAVQQDGAGFPETWYTRKTPDYTVDASVLAEQTYLDAFRSTLSDLPSLSLVMPLESWFDPIAGIYVQTEMQGISWEREAQVQWIENGESSFQLAAGVRIHGGASRNPLHPKHSMRLVFRSAYGEGSLEEPIYEDSDVDEFETLVLRGGLNNCWHYGKEAERLRAQYSRDVFTRQSQRDMGWLSSHSRPLHLFLNGLYWGLYMITERPDAAFLSKHLGGDESDWDALNSGEVLDGDSVAYETLLSLAREDLSISANYQAVQGYLNIDAFIDYFLLNLYVGNLDWDSHNWYGARRREDGEGFRFIVWDAERILEGVEDNVVSVFFEDQPSEIFQALRGNADFRARVHSRAEVHFAPGGPLSPEGAASRYKLLTDGVYDAVVGESARWGDARTQNLDHTRDAHWLIERQRLLEEYFPQRTAIVQEQLRLAGLYGEEASPTGTPVAEPTPTGTDSEHQDSEHDDSEHDDSEHDDSEHDDSEHDNSGHQDSNSQHQGETTATQSGH